VQARLGNGPQIGLVGTYPPTRCGIATFTSSLARAMVAVEPGCGFGVVACSDGRATTIEGPDVVDVLVHGSPASRTSAVDSLRRYDAVLLQHEFGIYGGTDGSEVLDLVRLLDVPVIAVLHTVPRRPSAGQRRIIEQLAVLAARLVVQSAAARARLLEQYVVEPDKVWTIPHGAHANLSAWPRDREAGVRPVVLTWGLLGRDKGIEWGIEAIAQLTDLEPAPRYLVLGQTHPRVLELEGEAYRDSLRARARALGVEQLVEFDDEYRDTAGLLRRVREADVVLLPYRSREQVVSGVLVDAVASGKPVVATRFPHAEELLGEGSGLLVPHEDADAMADALRRLLTDSRLAWRTAAAARRQARSLFWETIGERYLALVADVRRGTADARRRRPAFSRPPFRHLLALSDSIGVFEHAEFIRPRAEHGYCTDDVARALVALVREPARGPRLEQLVETCLSFLERAQLPDGRFRNRLSVDGRWLDDGDSDDATGRGLWAAGAAAVAAGRRSQRRRARAMFVRAASFRSHWPRSNAFAVLGAAEVVGSGSGTAATAAHALLEAASSRLGTAPADPRWPWPEPRLTYANAVLAEARIAAGAVLDNHALLAEGLELLAWLVHTELGGRAHFSFTPVGGWAAGEPRPAFDQQPIEAAAIADACARAYDVTGERAWADRALLAAAWFLGANDVGVPLLDAESGGCRDGLVRDGVNENEGAESTIALITALQQARRLQAAASRAPTSSALSTLAAPIHRSAAP
jgi:glycosyltransferase involved in cell wall biosynthesis